MEYIERACQNTFYTLQNKAKIVPETNTKTIGIYRVLGCFVLLKNQKLDSYEMGQANQRPQISTNDVRSIYSISLVWIWIQQPDNVHITTYFFVQSVESEEFKLETSHTVILPPRSRSLPVLKDDSDTQSTWDSIDYLAYSRSVTSLKTEMEVKVFKKETISIKY